MTGSKPRCIDLHAFDTRDALAEALAGRVADHLKQAVAERGHAMLALSGGSTPKRFLEALSRRQPGWDNITVSLVDERFVPPENERSNHRLVADHLLKNNASETRFVPLYQHVEDVDAAAALAAGKIDTLPLPFDVVILGMGSDGHTASFFPGGNNLEAATDRDEKRSVIAMKAPDAGEPRLTLTLPQVLAASLRVLHIEGAMKMKALDTARANGGADEMPIRTVLDAAASPVEVYWAE